MSTFVAFDLDGVLYSAEGFLGEAYREAIAQVNERHPGAFPRVPSTREILDHVGWPVPVILKRLFPSVDLNAMELLYDQTLPVICEHVRRREGEVFPDVAETLARLRRDGYLAGVASNGRRPYIDAVLDTYEIRPYFVELVAVESGSKTTKSDILRAYVDRYAPVSLVMVGDRASDVEAARDLGCHFIGCDYGHGYREEIDGAGPIIAQLVDLPKALRVLGL